MKHKSCHPPQVKKKMSPGTLVKCDGWLWDGYDKKQNSMLGNHQKVYNKFGMVLKVMPTVNIDDFGWVAKILVPTENGSPSIGWMWCDFIKQAPHLFVLVM